MFGTRSQLAALALLFGGVLACSSNTADNNATASTASTQPVPTGTAPLGQDGQSASPTASTPAPASGSPSQSSTTSNTATPSTATPNTVAPSAVVPSAEVPSSSAPASTETASLGGSSGSGGAGGNAGTAGSEAAGGATSSETAGEGGSAGTADGLAGSGGVAGAGGVGNPPLIERDEALRLIRLVADYYLERFGTNYDKSWLRSTFYTGLMAAYRTTLDEKYLTAARTWGAADGYAQPNVDSVDSNGEPRHADNQTCFQTYAELYELDPAPANASMLTTATAVFDSMVADPRTGRSEWSWCDSLFMAPPALARFAVISNEPAYAELMNDMFWDTKEYLFDPSAGFFWRDNARRNTAFWSRGNGWVFAGIARILEYLPATDTRRDDYEALLREMATSLQAAQNPDDGLWRSDLLNADAYPNPESSGTAFFCFGLAWGIHHGVLDRDTFEPVALKAWQGLVDVALTAEGLVGWVQGPAHTPGPAERMGTNDYAAGAFLLAASEMIEL